MCDELEQELDRGSQLATELVDHMTAMGGAAAGIIPVLDRAEEYVVIVMSKASYERRGWPINPLPNPE